MPLRPAVATAATALTLTIASVLAPALPANAEAQSDATTAIAAPRAADEHCALDLAAVAAAAELGRISPEPVCFASIEEVDEFLERRSVAAAESRLATAAASVGVGRIYKDANKGGSSLTFWGANGCVGATYGFPSLSSGWNTSVSSLTGLNGCWATAYTATSYGGSRVNCTPYCGSLGSFNDRVKSLVFRPNGTLG